MFRERPGQQTQAAVHRAVTSAFVALLVGVVAIEIVLLAALHAPLAGVSRIADEHARAVSVASRVRSELSSLRSALIGCVTGGRRPVLCADRYGRVGQVASELEPFADTAEERESVVALRAALDVSADTCARVEEALHLGDSAAARARLQPFLVETSAASDAADAFLRFNAREVREAAGSVRNRLVWTLAWSSALALVVIGAGFVLVRQARHAIERHGLALERQSDLMGAFASRAAHELRNPLQALTLSLAALDRGHANARALAKANAAAVRLRETIDVILEFSRAGAFLVVETGADVAAVVRDVFSDLGRAAEEADVVLACDVPDGMDVAIAPAHLRIVISNLVANSVKYCAGSPGARVDVTARRFAREVELTVTDNGPGIAPEALPHVFEPLYRASTSPGGFGLGLATVEQIVRAHGGRAVIESAVGRGTTVVVRLPVNLGRAQRL